MDIIANKNTDYAPFAEDVIGDVPTAVHPGRHQRCHQGSFMKVKSWPPGSCDSFVFECWAQPTLIDAGHAQTIFSTVHHRKNNGVELLINLRNQFEVWIGDGSKLARHVIDFCVDSGTWYKISFEVTTHRFKINITTKSHDIGCRPPFVQSLDLKTSYHCSETPLLMGASYHDYNENETTVPCGCFNGKLDHPKITSLEGHIIAEWDFFQGMDSDITSDVSGNGNHGVFINAPTRAVTGHDWDATCNDWKSATYGYGAVHFHQDDLDDACWENDFEIALPSNLRSGVYSVHVWTDSGAYDHIIFFVRPATSSKASVAFVLDTFTYLAYSNEHLFEKAFGTGGPFRPVESPDYQRMRQRKDVGLALYDCHADGHGVVYASWKRPLLNIKPTYIHPLFGKPRELSIDIYFINWLEHQDFDYDVLFAHDVHSLGVDYLKR